MKNLIFYFAKEKTALSFVLHNKFEMNCWFSGRSPEYNVTEISKCGEGALIVAESGWLNGLHCVQWMIME